MIQAQASSAFSFIRLCRGIVAMAGLAVALSACGAMGIKRDEQAEVLSYQHREETGFVRIERIEPGAPDNTHPAKLSPEALRQALANLNVKGASSMAPTPVFTKEELDTLVPPLVAALAKAGPKEDVTFAITGAHGILGKYSAKAVTTGRVFVLDQLVNVVFGIVHEPYELQTGETDVSRRFTPGLRARRVESGWTLLPGTARLAGNRADWTMLNVAPASVTSTTAAPQSRSGGPGDAAPPASTPAAAVTTDSRYQEIEQRLRVLDRLKANGLITEGEYRERRHAILQAL